MGLMGGLLSRSDGSYQVVLVGLDGAGKSTLLYRLKTHAFAQPPPTIGFNCEKVYTSSHPAFFCHKEEHYSCFQNIF